MWILVVEDERRLAGLLRRGLEAEGYTVDLAEDGLEGEEKALLNAYDLIVVDWRLPGQTGDQVTANLRRQGIKIPILMLTVLDDVEHRVAGLDAGADDYLTKPFSFDELHARLRALLRRSPMDESSSVLTLGRMRMDIRKKSVWCQDEEMILRPKEFSLLEEFLRQEGAVLSRTVLAERVWGSALYVSDNVLDVTISGLRSHLMEHQCTGVKLETIRGRGYRLVKTES